MSGLDLFALALLGLLLVTGVGACLSKNLLVTLIIFMAYSVIMSIIWAMLEAPDLAITEAAVGAGVSGILMFLSLKKIRDLKRKAEKDEETEI